MKSTSAIQDVPVVSAEEQTATAATEEFNQANQFTIHWHMIVGEELLQLLADLPCIIPAILLYLCPWRHSTMVAIMLVLSI